MMEMETNSWRGVHQELLRRINEKELAPGSMIPNEAELAKEFGCARTTVNRAMRALADAGIVDRRRRAGSRVALHPTSRIVLDIPLIRLEVEQRNAEWHYSLLNQSISPAPLSVTSRLGLSRGAVMLHMTCLHFADKRPFLHEDRWINPAVLPGVEVVDFSTISPNEWLVQHAPYTSGDIAFSATNADQALGDLLDASVGAALFVVDRITWNNGQPITSVRLCYAPGYNLNTRI